MAKTAKGKTPRPKDRLDKVMVDQGLVSSRQRAQGLILAGKVLVQGTPVVKVGTLISQQAAISIIGEDQPYVSRGGVKLEGALKGFGIDPKEMTVLDVGSSTGGFTDCLLSHGVRRVYAVDVGYGQLAWSLRNDPRVVVLERTHIRDLTQEQVSSGVDLITIDVSFISLKKVIPHAIKFLKSDGTLLCLVKPQFEVGKKFVEKGGIIRSGEKREAVIKGLFDFLVELGFDPKGFLPSVLKGQKGNQEYFIYAHQRRKKT